MRCAYWGEILTATAKKRGAVGAVINGYHRDTPKVLEQDWPVFSRGRFAQDSGVRTQVVGTQVEAPGGAGPSEEALRSEAVDEVGEDREDVDPHAPHGSQAAGQGERRLQAATEAPIGERSETRRLRRR